MLNLRVCGYSSLILIALMTISLTGCDDMPSATDDDSISPNDYVGSVTCAECHQEETKRWSGSHHDLAIQPATKETVLGDFADTRFIHNKITSRFFSKDGKYFVETDGENGKIDSFPIRYTFGVTPLQQYLVELPNGKLQALGIAWDSRPADEGGQHWFHVYGQEPIDHKDVLHWTRFSANWETMCADCHSTNLLSKYDLEQDRFTTTWDELNVSCEACHGPGSRHIAWVHDNPDSESLPHAGFDIAFDERRNVVWQLQAKTGNSQRSMPRITSTEINACAGCHSRRSRIADNNDPAVPFLDNYIPAFIDPPLYHPDGQMLDEVYVYGSFLQSKMHQAGVTCSDCHDPHSTQLRAPGPAVCLQCHSAEIFATDRHQMHPPERTNCIDCHMPATTYMQNDARSDHSLRIPRPELSVAYGVPNACNNCHTDKNAAWAVSVLETAGRIKPGEATSHWSGRLAAATIADSYAVSMDALMELANDPSAPVIIRGTVASRLRLGDGPDTRTLLSQLSGSPEPLLRLGAANALQNSDPKLAVAFAPALLDDPLLAVRISAAQALAGIDPVLLPAGSNPLLQNALKEFISAQQINNERAESHINIGNLHRTQGRIELAEPAYRQALKLNPGFVPAYVNMADMYREWNREGDAEAVLRAGLAAVPDDAYLHHSLGLALVRQNRLQEALPELKLAADSSDAVARFALVYALALEGIGKYGEASAYLAAAKSRFGDDPELVDALNKMQKSNNSGVD